MAAWQTGVSRLIWTFTWKRRKSSEGRRKMTSKRISERRTKSRVKDKRREVSGTVSLKVL